MLADHPWLEPEDLPGGSSGSVRRHSGGRPSKKLGEPDAPEEAGQPLSEDLPPEAGEPVDVSAELASIRHD
eukprot:3797336-Alexandrium_andersonii.AAC.1